MLLSEELEQNIRQSWLRLRPKILSDPYELHRRLARRRLKSLTQPPRAWCIAIRASDRRITPMHWVISPEHALDLNHPEHPYEPTEHEVTIQYHAIRRYCHPVSFWIERAKNVARLLGVSPAMLMHARNKGRFFEDYKRGPRGPRVPFLSPNGQLFDPSHRDYQPPHPIWGSMWELLCREFPRDFEQTVLRRPLFRTMTAKSAAPTEKGWEAHAYKDEMQHIGWRWLCPQCKKQVSTIYYPLPVRTLFNYGEFDDPAIELKLPQADLPQPPQPTFACHACHRISYGPSVDPDSWNRVIAHLTAGMLYGSEVQKPASFVTHRKNTRARQLDRSAPVRRKVFAALKLGLPDSQIARDLRINLITVGTHIARICREERVANRYDLAKKLNFAPQPVNKFEAAKRRRVMVADMLLQDCSLKEMMQNLGVNELTLNRDIRAIYKAHGIKPQTCLSKRQLAQKMGRQLVSPWEDLLHHVKQLRATGLKWNQIAAQLGVGTSRMNSYRQALARREKSHAAKVAEATEPPGMRALPLQSEEVGDNGRCNVANS